MKPPLRIAILECDTPAIKTQSKYGGYGGVFKALLETSADALDMPNVISSRTGMEINAYDVVNAESYPDIAGTDAVLLTGSRYNSYDNDPWILKLVDFVKELLAQDRVRIIGVCFGHQIIGRAMGVKVGHGPADWEVSVCKMDLTPKGKQLFGKDTIVSSIAFEVTISADPVAQRIHQMHTDIVYDCPSGVEALGSSPACAVQGMYAKDKIITLGGHPEFNQQIVSELLELTNSRGILDQTRFEDGMARVAQEHDGIEVGKAFLRFLLDD